MTNPVFLNDLRKNWFRRRPVHAVALMAILILVLTLFVAAGASALFGFSSASYPLWRFPDLLLPVIAPAFAASAFAKEHEQRTWQDLLLTRLTAGEIVVGKFLACFFPTIATVIVLMPPFALILIMSGIQWAQEPGLWMLAVALRFLALAVFYLVVGLVCSYHSANARASLVTGYVVIALYGIGRVYYSTGQARKALVQYEQALPTLEANDCRENKQGGIAYRGSTGGTARTNTCTGNATPGITARARRGLGRIGDHMIELARAEQVDAIVVGTGQKTGLGRLGSVSSVVVQDAPESVVCVPPQAVVITQKVPVIDQALVATDLSQFANRAVPYAFALTQRGGLVHILHVVKEDAEIDEPALIAQLEALAPAGATHNVRAHIVRGDDAASAMAQCAARFGVDVICIASHGRSGISRALVGSVADRLLRATRLPVLVLRPT